jgi:hypothetical protein
MKWIAIIVAGAICGAAIAVMTGCPSKYAGLATGYRTVGLVRDTASEADRAVGSWLTATHERCAGKHAKGSSGYVDCSRSALEVHGRWRISRTAIQSAIHATIGALRAHHAALDAGRDGEALDWIRLAKPLVCGLARAIRALGPYIKKPSVGAVLALAEGVTCVD